MQGKISLRLSSRAETIDFLPQMERKRRCLNVLNTGTKNLFIYIALLFVSWPLSHIKKSIPLIVVLPSFHLLTPVEGSRLDK